MGRGKHLLIDIWGVSEEKCSDTPFLLNMMKEAAILIGATIVDSAIHSLFDPPGATGFLLLDESHISCHTYSDRGWVALDIFVCGEGKDPLLGWALVKERLEIGNTYSLALEERFFGPVLTGV